MDLPGISAPVHDGASHLLCGGCSWFFGERERLMAVKTSAKVLAAEFVAKAKEYGFSYSVTDSVVTVAKKIKPNDNLEFANAESDAWSLLEIAPNKGGSVWGTDGGSIGGAVAMTTGFFKLNKSGSGGKTFAAEVAKLKGK